MAFDYILSHKKIYIDDGELIVGERGPEPKAVPTYPEVSLHSLEPSNSEYQAEGIISSG